MIKVSVEKKDNSYKRIICDGHAGFDEYGRDIVCAAVSVLVLNTLNSIDHFTDDKMMVDQKEDGGYILAAFPEEISDQTKLLLDSMVLGLETIRDEYGKKYLTFKILEV